MERTSIEVAGQQVPMFTAIVEVISESSKEHVQIRQGRTTVLPSVTDRAGPLVIPGEIYSTSDSEQRIWIRGEDGREKQLTIWNRDLAVRPGHKLRLAWFGSSNGEPYCITNLTTGEHSRATSAPDLAKEIGFNPMHGYARSGRWTTVLFFLALFLLGGAFGASTWYESSYGNQARYKRLDLCQTMLRPVNPKVAPTSHYGVLPIYPKGTRMTEESVAAMNVCRAANTEPKELKSAVGAGSVAGYTAGAVALLAWFVSLFNAAFAKTERRKRGIEQFASAVTSSLAIASQGARA